MSYNNLSDLGSSEAEAHENPLTEREKDIIKDNLETVADTLIPYMWHSIANEGREAAYTVGWDIECEDSEKNIVTLQCGAVITLGLKLPSETKGVVSSAATTDED
jgi:hypothetical protein